MLMTDDPACWEPDVDLGGQFRLSGTLGKTVVTIAVRGHWPLIATIENSQSPTPIGACGYCRKRHRNSVGLYPCARSDGRWCGCIRWSRSHRRGSADPRAAVERTDSRSCKTAPHRVKLRS